MFDPETELIRLALQGDTNAVRDLVRMITPAIHQGVSSTLLRRTSSSHRSRVRHEVEDVTQEVLFALFANRGKRLLAWNQEKGLSFTHYVRLVARHLAESFLRRRARRVWEDEPIDDASPGVVDEHKSPERLVGERELYQAVLAAVRAELSPKGLQLFQWLVLEERSVADICQLSGLTQNAVHLWRSRLLQRIDEARLRILHGAVADE
jgi:RNA polymerase sigma factor (sigma-70 family)